MYNNNNECQNYTHKRQTTIHMIRNIRSRTFVTSLMRWRLRRAVTGTKYKDKQQQHRQRQRQQHCPFMGLSTMLTITGITDMWQLHKLRGNNEFLAQLAELFIQAGQNVVCVSVWMLTRVAQIVTVKWTWIGTFKPAEPEYVWCLYHLNDC